jgi:hypothetical protein
MWGHILARPLAPTLLIMDDASSYEALLSENATLRRTLKELENRTRKKVKRKPNAYQMRWAIEYKLEVERAKSVNAKLPAQYRGITLQGYGKRYPESMNTSPHPKNGEPLLDADRKMFMRSVAARAKAFLASEKEETESKCAAPPQSADEHPPVQFGEPPEQVP